MPQSDKPNKSLKYLTIGAIVLLVIVLVPCFVIEKARRDVRGFYPRNARVELKGIEFDTQQFVTLKFAPVKGFDASSGITINWSLAQWGVPDGELARVITEELRREREINPDLEIQYENVPPIKVTQFNDSAE